MNIRNVEARLAKIEAKHSQGGYLLVWRKPGESIGTSELATTGKIISPEWLGEGSAPVPRWLNTGSRSELTPKEWASIDLSLRRIAGKYSKAARRAVQDDAGTRERYVQMTDHELLHGLFGVTVQ